jgi:hypothetical protein
MPQMPREPCQDDRYAAGAQLGIWSQDQFLPVLRRESGRPAYKADLGQPTAAVQPDQLSRSRRDDSASPGRAWRRGGISCDHPPSAGAVTSRLMTETIRDRFKRRRRLAGSLYMGGLLVLVLSMAWIGFDNPQPGLALILPILGMAVFCVGLVLSGTAQCPRCRTTVSPWVSMYPAFRFPFSGPPKCCPRCGVSLDEPASP